MAALEGNERFICSNCLKDKQLKKMNGCESPVENGFVFEEPYNYERFKQCPIKFIPNEVWQFMQIEIFNEAHNVQHENWHNTSARYTHYKMKYMEHKNYITKLRKAELKKGK